MSEFSPPPMEDISPISDFPPSMNGFSPPPPEMELESSYDLTGLSDKLGSLELDKVKILPPREILELQQESEQLNTLYKNSVRLDLPPTGIVNGELTNEDNCDNLDNISDNHIISNGVSDIENNFEESDTDSEIGIDDSITDELEPVNTYHISSGVENGDANINECNIPAPDIVCDNEMNYDLPLHTNDNNEDAFNMVNNHDPVHPEGERTCDLKSEEHKTDNLEVDKISSDNDSPSITNSESWGNVWSTNTVNDDDWVTNSGDDNWGDTAPVSDSRTKHVSEDQVELEFDDDDDDDEFGDFGLADDQSQVMSGKEIEIVNEVWGPQTDVEPREEEVVIKRLSESVFEDEQVFLQLEDPASTPGLEHRWRESAAYNMLLNTLSIDTRVVLDGENWRSSVPNYAPKTAANLLTPGELLTPVVASSTPSPPEGRATPEPEFDWNNSGLTNPLGIESGTSEESLSQQSEKEAAPKLITELLSSQKKTQAVKLRGQDQIINHKELRNPSKEAQEVVSAFPLLDFMHSKLLTLPSNHKK